MGLDITYGCWVGSYPSFHQFRARLARLIGIDVMVHTGYGGVYPWPSRDEEPLVILLDHSDIEGEISTDDCVRLMARLEELLPRTTTDAWLRDKTMVFSAGLRRATMRGHGVKFK